MNFGICGIPSTFQNYINNILHDYLDIFCFAYIEVILIYNKTKKKHSKHIRLVFQKLQKTGLQLHVDKCEFYIPKIKFLGFIITTENIKINFKKSRQFLIGRNLRISKKFKTF